MRLQFQISPKKFSLGGELAKMFTVVPSNNAKVPNIFVMYYLGEIIL
jgi:hypothetical protein